MDLKAKLKRAEAEARAARERHKKTLRAVKHLRALTGELDDIKKDPGALNIELAFEGDILLDFDLEDYPELTGPVMDMCEQLRMAALSRVDEVVPEN